MRKSDRGLFFLKVILIAFVLAFGQYSPAMSRSASDNNKPCIQKINVTRGSSNPFRESDSKMTGHEWNTIKISKLDDDSFRALPGLSLPNGDKLMGIGTKPAEPAVSDKYFSRMVRVDATRIEPGQQKDIGQLTHAGLNTIGPRDVVIFLIRSQIIVTYWHVESDMCLIQESDSADSYTASFHGIHRYYTNKYNEGELDFTVGINKESGVITLLGGASL